MSNEYPFWSVLAPKVFDTLERHTISPSSSVYSKGEDKLEGFLERVCSLFSRTPNEKIELEVETGWYTPNKALIYDALLKEGYEIFLALKEGETWHLTIRREEFPC